jgi:hypothetical protein
MPNGQPRAPGDRWLEMNKMTPGVTNDLTFVIETNLEQYQRKGWQATGRWALMSDYQDAIREAQRWRGIGDHGNGDVYFPTAIYA